MPDDDRITNESEGTELNGSTDSEAAGGGIATYSTTAGEEAPGDSSGDVGPPARAQRMFFRPWLLNPFSVPKVNRPVNLDV